MVLARSVPNVSEGVKKRIVQYELMTLLRYGHYKELNKTILGQGLWMFLKSGNFFGRNYAKHFPCNCLPDSKIAGIVLRCKFAPFYPLLVAGCEPFIRT